jgi:hypothetical protein
LQDIAIYKGSKRINGQTPFMVCQDGDKKEVNEPDKSRIKDLAECKLLRLFMITN